MSNRSVTKVLAAVCVLAAVGGCSGVRVNVVEGTRPSGPFRVGVLDFKASTDPVETLLGAREVNQIENAGPIVADAVSVALVDVDQLHVVEGRQLTQVMTELKLTPENVLTPENLKKLGQATGIDGVVVGYVTDFHWWQVALCSGSELAFSVRMVSTETGQVLWSASVARSGRVSHTTLLFDACAALADKLESALD